MPSAVSTAIDLETTPERAYDAVRRVVTENRHTLVDESPAEGRVDFVTRKTGLSWELGARALVTAHGTGSRVDLSLDTMPDRPQALLDGWKNKKSAARLAEQVRAAVV